MEHLHIVINGLTIWFLLILKKKCNKNSTTLSVYFLMNSEKKMQNDLT